MSKYHPTGRKKGAPVIEYLMTQEEVARALGISRTRVQQLEASAFKKIRKALDLDE